MPRSSPPPLALVPVVLLLALAGCAAEDEGTVAVSAPPATVAFTAGEVPVLLPGAPGESAEVVEPGSSSSFANASAYGESEVDFLEGMVPHHGQALVMADLAVERASDERVVALAERIAAAQGPEIAVMQAWLEAQGLPPAEVEAGHGSHQAMRGMATPEQLFELEYAEGGQFDRMFLELMTEHHEGALQMAEAASGVTHPVVSEMVDDVVASQGAEIARMQQLLDQLP